MVVDTFDVSSVTECPARFQPDISAEAFRVEVPKQHGVLVYIDKTFVDVVPPEVVVVINSGEIHEVVETTGQLNHGQDVLGIIAEFQGPGENIFVDTGVHEFSGQPVQNGKVVVNRALVSQTTQTVNGWAAQNGVGSVLQASNFRQELTVWVNDSKRWTRYDPAKLCQITGDKKAAKELLEQYPIEELQAKGWEYDLRGIQWEEYRCYLSQDARRKRRRGGIIWRGVD